MIDMGCRIYSVSGDFPSMAKGTLLYTFENEPEGLKEGIKKSPEQDEVLGYTAKESWDTYALDRTLTITGKFGSDVATSISTRMQNLEKLQSYYPTASTYPTGGQFIDSNSDPQVYAFEYDIPDGTTRTIFGIITGLDFDTDATYISYVVNVVGTSLVAII